MNFSYRAVPNMKAELSEHNNNVLRAMETPDLEPSCNSVTHKASFEQSDLRTEIRLATYIRKLKDDGILYTPLHTLLTGARSSTLSRTPAGCSCLRSSISSTIRRQRRSIIGQIYSSSAFTNKNISWRNQKRKFAKL